MDLAVRIEPLAQQQIELAFPLAQAIAPDLTLDRWRGYAQSMVSPQGPYRHGIMGAWSSTGYLHGMFGFMVTPDLALERVLQIENFVAMDIRGSGRAANAMVDSVRDIAAAERCAAVHAAVPACFAPLFEQCDLVPVLHAQDARKVLRRSWLVGRSGAVQSQAPERP